MSTHAITFKDHPKPTGAVMGFIYPARSNGYTDYIEIVEAEDASKPGSTAYIPDFEILDKNKEGGDMWQGVVRMQVEWDKVHYHAFWHNDSAKMPRNIFSEAGRMYQNRAHGTLVVLLWAGGDNYMKPDYIDGPSEDTFLKVVQRVREIDGPKWSKQDFDNAVANSNKAVPGTS